MTDFLATAHGQLVSEQARTAKKTFKLLVTTSQMCDITLLTKINEIQNIKIEKSLQHKSSDSKIIRCLSAVNTSMFLTPLNF